MGDAAAFSWDLGNHNAGSRVGAGKHSVVSSVRDPAARLSAGQRSLADPAGRNIMQRMYRIYPASHRQGLLSAG